MPTINWENVVSVTKGCDFNSCEMTLKLLTPGRPAVELGLGNGLPAGRGRLAAFLEERALGAVSTASALASSCSP